METRRKLSSLIILSVMILWFGTSAHGMLLTANAQQIEKQEIIINPMTEIIVQGNATLAISNSGTATITAKVSGMSGTSKVEITAILEKYENNKWIEITSFSKSNSSNSTTLNETYTVSKGTYRVSAILIAYKGTSSETVTATSASRTY